MNRSHTPGREHEHRAENKAQTLILPSHSLTLPSTPGRACALTLPLPKGSGSVRDTAPLGARENQPETSRSRRECEGGSASVGPLPYPPSTNPGHARECLATAEHLTWVFGQIERKGRGKGGAELHQLLATPDELEAHVQAGWLCETTGREGDEVVVRFSVTREGWLAIDALLDEAARG